MDGSDLSIPPSSSSTSTKEPGRATADNEAALLLLGLVGPESPTGQPPSSPASSNVLPSDQGGGSAQSAVDLATPSPLTGPSAFQSSHNSAINRSDGQHSLAAGKTSSPVPTHMNTLPPPLGSRQNSDGPARSQTITTFPSHFQYLAPIPPSLQDPPLHTFSASNPSPPSSASLNNLLNGPSASIPRILPTSNTVPLNPPMTMVNTTIPLMNGYGPSAQPGSTQSIYTSSLDQKKVPMPFPPVNGIPAAERKLSYHVATGQAWLPPTPQTMPNTLSTTQAQSPYANKISLSNSTTPPSPAFNAPHPVVTSSIATGQRKRKRSEAPTQAANLSPKPASNSAPQMGTFSASSSGTLPASSSGTIPSSLSGNTLGSPITGSFIAGAQAVTPSGEALAEGGDDQGYRCACGTDIEPEEGASIQCDLCQYWQHAGCYVGANEIIEAAGDIPYQCGFCAAHPLKEDKAFMASMRAQKVRREQQKVDGTAFPLSSTMGGMDGILPTGMQLNMGAPVTPREGSKKTRGGGTGGKRTKVKEVNVPLANLMDVDTQEAVIGDASGDQAMPEAGPSTGPSAAAKEKKKRMPNLNRPPKIKAVTREATPKEPGSDNSPTTLTDLGRKSPAIALVKTVEVEREPPAPQPNNPPARLLDFVPVKRNIIRGRIVRDAIATLSDEWSYMEHDQGRPLKRKRAVSIGKATSRVAEEGDLMACRASGPGWEPSFEVLGPPVPPVVAFGPAFSDSVALSVVKEKDERVPLFPSSTLAYETRTEEEQPSENSVRFSRLYGVHTVNLVQSGTFFGEYIGEVQSGEAYQRDPVNQYSSLGITKPFVHRLGPPVDLVLDARCYGNDLRFIRSGCHPNVVLRPYLHHPSSRNSEQAPHVAFGIFACGTIDAGQELVLGWEWDDQHVIHLLAETTSASNARVKLERLPAIARLRLGTLAKQLLGNISSCACQDDRKCALWRLLHVTLPETPKVEGSGRALLGPLIGAVRGWRFKAVQDMEADLANREISGAAASALGLIGDLALTPVGGVMEEADADTEMDGTVPDQAVSSIQISSARLVVGDDESVERDAQLLAAKVIRRSEPPPTPQAPASSPLTVPPTSPLTRTETASSRNGGGAALSGDALSAVPRLSAKYDADDRMSETSTLTEPLSHATDSEASDDEQEIDDGPEIVGAPSPRPSPSISRREQLMSSRPNRASTASFRRARRIMSPSPGPSSEEVGTYSKKFARSSEKPDETKGSKASSSAAAIGTSAPLANGRPRKRSNTNGDENAISQVKVELAAGSSLSGNKAAPLDLPLPELPESLVESPPPIKEDEPVLPPIPEAPAPPQKRRRLDLRQFTQPSVNVDPTDTASPAPPLPPAAITDSSDLVKSTASGFLADGIVGSIAVGRLTSGANTDASPADIAPSTPGYTPNWWDAPSSTAKAGAEKDLSYFPVETPVKPLPIGPTRPALEEETKPQIAEETLYKPLGVHTELNNNFSAAKVGALVEALRPANLPRPTLDTSEQQIGSFASSSATEDPWSRIPSALSTRDAPPHVEDISRSKLPEDPYPGDGSLSPPFRIQSLSSAGNSSTASPSTRPIPAGPRAHFSARSDRKESWDRDREWESRGGESRDNSEREKEKERDWDKTVERERDSRDSGERPTITRDLPRGPRADRAPERGRGGFAPSSPAVRGGGGPSRGGPFQPRGGSWPASSEGYRGRGRGTGESYRGRGSAFSSRGRGGGGYFGGPRGRGA